MNDKEAEFVQRLPHTQAEDWIIFHPKITPLALMLYMRLRGAVMDPRSAAADWKKVSRFTVEQMRLMLPASRTHKQGVVTDAFAGKRTVNDALALLTEIGALKRVDTPGSPVPKYDFPVYPPDDHEGPVWGGTVATEVREKTQHRMPGRPAKNPCATPQGVRYTAGVYEKGCATPQGVCGAPQGVKPLTREAPGLKEALEKNPPLPQEEAPAGAGPEEDEEALRAMLHAFGVQAQGQDRVRMLAAMCDLRRDGWSRDQITGLFVHTRWNKISVPNRYVLKTLEAAVGTVGIETPQESQKAQLAVLRASRAAQMREIGECAGCNERGNEFDTYAWHGHGDEMLKRKIQALEDPERTAMPLTVEEARSA